MPAWFNLILAFVLVIANGFFVAAEFALVKVRVSRVEQLVVQRYGNIDNFRTRLREDMIINRNIEDHVYAGIDDPRQQQSQLQAWYADLQKETEVIIFDPQLKAVGQGSGGCACCNS